MNNVLSSEHGIMKSNSAAGIFHDARYVSRAIVLHNAKFTEKRYSFFI
jgi:hypothetical protein